MTEVGLTRRRALGGLLTVGFGGAATGAGTMALFSDSSTSSGNTIQAGTLELTFGSPNSIELTTDLAPGGSVAGSIRLVKQGSVPGTLHVATSYSNDDDPDSTNDKTGDEVARNLEVRTLRYGGSPILGSVPDQNNNGDPDLEDLKNDDLTDLADPGSGTDFEIGLTLDDTVGNEFQGEGVAITFTFHLTQQT